MGSFRTRNGWPICGRRTPPPIWRCLKDAIKPSGCRSWKNWTPNATPQKWQRRLRQRLHIRQRRRRYEAEGCEFRPFWAFLFCDCSEKGTRGRASSGSQTACLLSDGHAPEWVSAHDCWRCPDFSTSVRQDLENGKTGHGEGNYCSRKMVTSFWQFCDSKLGGVPYPAGPLSIWNLTSGVRFAQGNRTAGIRSGCRESCLIFSALVA